MANILILRRSRQKFRDYGLEMKQAKLRLKISGTDFKGLFTK
jgi:hypothetical protein